MSKRVCAYPNDDDIRKIVHWKKGIMHFRKHDMPNREFYMGQMKEFSFNNTGANSLTIPYLISDDSIIKFMMKSKRNRGIMYKREIEVSLFNNGNIVEIK